MTTQAGQITRVSGTLGAQGVPSRYLARWFEGATDDPLHEHRAMSDVCSTVVLWAGVPRFVCGTSVEALNGLGLPNIHLSIQEITRRTYPGEPWIFA